MKRLAGGLHQALVAANVVVVEVVGPPLVGGLTVKRAPAFEGDVMQVLTEEQGRFRGIELAAIERSKEGCAGLQIQAHSRSEAKLSGGVLTGWYIHRATTGFSASIDGLLEGGARVVLFDPGCAVFLHVVHNLAGKPRSGRGNACKKLSAEQ